MSLLMFEMKKLFLKRSILIVTILFMLIPLIPYIYGNIYSNSYVSPLKYYEFARPYEGSIDQKIASEAHEAIAKQMELKMKNRTEASDEYTPEQWIFYIDYYNTSMALDKYRNGDIKENPEEPYSLNGIKNRIDKLEVESKQNTYEYRMRKMQYNALESSGAPEFRYVRPWDNLFSFTTMGAGYLFIAFLLLFVISPIFSNERTTGMDSIILSSRHGRVKAVTAKLTATIIYTIVVILVNSLLQLTVYIGMVGTMGWNAPLKSIYGYVLCPYGITVLHFFMLQVGLQIFGSIIIVITIAFVSSLCRSALPTFFISIFAIFYPFILGNLLVIKVAWLQPIIDLSALQLAVVHKIFASFKAYNLFGNPIPYVYLLIPVVTTIGIVLTMLTYKAVRRQQVC